MIKETGVPIKAASKYILLKSENTASIQKCSVFKNHFEAITWSGWTLCQKVKFSSVLMLKFLKRCAQGWELNLAPLCPAGASLLWASGRVLFNMLIHCTMLLAQIKLDRMTRVTEVHFLWSVTTTFCRGVCTAGSASMKVQGRLRKGRYVFCDVDLTAPCAIQGKHYSEGWVTVCLALHLVICNSLNSNSLWHNFKELKVIGSLRF